MNMLKKRTGLHSSMPVCHQFLCRCNIPFTPAAPVLNFMLNFRKEIFNVLICVINNNANNIQ